MENKKIVVGLSGGVDSSVAMLLLQKQGWQPIGVSLKYCVWEDKKNQLRENVCCNHQAFSIAKKVCEKIEVPYHVVEVSNQFQKQVIGYFISDLKSGLTPNPCIICNRCLKFPQLLAFAQKQKADFISTGHYAKIDKNKMIMKVGKDKLKDQTYSLCFLKQKWLKSIIFPLENLTKKEVYKIAKDNGFHYFEKRKQSQDFCFVANKALPFFIKKVIGQNPGKIVDKEGKILGAHQGLHFYTLGQRKGINLPHGPWFVVAKDEKENQLIVAKKENEKLFFKKIINLSLFNLFIDIPMNNSIKVSVKIRSNHKPQLARLKKLPNGKLSLVFDVPQRAITPGQFAVIYQDEVCLGGGKIL